jgi:hypothetical protein
MAVFREKDGHSTLRLSHKPCYTNVVIADNPQRCYCRCNLISVILSLLAKIMALQGEDFRNLKNAQNNLNNWMRFRLVQCATNLVYKCATNSVY